MFWFALSNGFDFHTLYLLGFTHKLILLLASLNAIHLTLLILLGLTLNVVSLHYHWVSVAITLYYSDNLLFGIN